MEKPVKKEQQIEKLLKPSYVVVKKDEDYYMSIYKTGQLTIEGKKKESLRLKKSFPGLEAGFYDVLWERCDELRISDKKLHDAVTNIIDTCKYPIPTIASIIQYDKPVRLYTYDQMLFMRDHADENIFNKCKILKTENGTFYIKK